MIKKTIAAVVALFVGTFVTQFIVTYLRSES